MPAEYLGFRYKTPERLHDQVQAAQYTGDIQLIPPTLQNDEASYHALISTPAQDLNDRYNLRMSVYTELLRRQRKGEDVTEDMQRQFRRISALNNMDEYIADHYDQGTETTLRGRQASVFEGIRNHLENGKTKGYVTLPTGSGKTVLFAEVVEAMGLRTLIVVPTLPILDQTKEKFEQFAQGVDVGKVYGREKDTHKQVTVITHDSLRIQTANGTIDPQEYDVVVVDEAHENLSPKRRKLLSEFDHALQLGFTATPEYQEGKPEKHIKSVFEDEIHSMSIREAIKEDMLCGFTIMNVKTHVDISDVQIQNGKYSPDQIERAVNIHRRNHAPLTIYQEAFNGQSAIAFCASISHAEDVAQLFIEAGIPAAAIHSKLDKDVRKDLIEKYESGEIKVLMGVDILTRGFDAPNAQVCFNLVPTLSKVVALQRAGRVLRIDEKNPNKVATIVEFDDDDSRGLQFGNLIEPGESHAELLSDNLTEGQRQHVERTRSQLETINIEGMEIQYELEEVLEVLKVDSDYKRIVEFPANYIRFSITELAQHLSTTYRRLTRLIATFSEERGYLYTFGGGGGRNGGAMHPDVYQAILNELAKGDIIPEGYVEIRISNLAQQLNMSLPTLKRLISHHSINLGYEYYLSNPRVRSKNLIHMSVYEALINERRISTDVPEGYIVISIQKLVAQLSTSKPTLVNRIIDLSSQNGVSYRFGKHGSGGVTSFIHESVYEALISEFSKRTEVPDGYLEFRLRELARELRTSVPMLKERIIAISNQGGWEYKFAGRGSGDTNFMHPQVYAAIIEELSRTNKVPEGYMKVKMSNLARQLSLSNEELKISIRRLSRGAGYVYGFGGMGTRSINFIHPDVYQELINESIGRAMPNGYVEIKLQELMQQLSVGVKRLKKCIVTFSEASGYQYRIERGKRSYIHPEVYQMLIDEFSRSTIPE